jgi:RND family efflux transporter MFP subunit
MPQVTRFASCTTVLILTFITVACGGGQPAGAGAGGGRGRGGPGGPAPVKLVTLEQKPVEQASEFIAQLRSLRSTTIQPEVDGIVTRVFVKPGDRVRAGTALLQINADKQSASVRSTEANRSGIAADVEYWREHVKRLESLQQAGAISRQELQQAQTSLRTAEARLSALDAQVREGRVELQYYRVNAPQAGVVGDIIVRAGDRVTPATVITTIDDNSSMEADIAVPLNRSPDLKIGLPVQLLDAEGKVVATNPVSFVAPRVDDRTQTVLVKSVLKQAPPSARVQQFARARIVWQNAPGLTVPLTAVMRVSGKHFCYVADAKDGGLVARQQPIEVGELVGNEYVVLGGLKAGDRVVVSGIQKIGHGMPIKPE